MFMDCVRVKGHMSELFPCFMNIASISNYWCRNSLSHAGLLRRDHWVINEVIQRGIPCVTVIGGGYDKDIDRLAARHSIVHRAAKKVRYDKVCVCVCYYR